MTAPAIYLHFADKHALLGSACLDSFEQVDEAVGAAIEGIPDPVEALCAFARAHIGRALERPEQYRFLFMGRADAERSQPRLDEVCSLAPLRPTPRPRGAPLGLRRPARR